jgi:phosphoribosyl 1,2-cyclic phosphodiesterase
VLRFCSLGSGSSGNALLVEAADGLFPVRILVDDGFGVRQLERRLTRAGVEPESIAALFVTHEHEDHAGGAAAFAGRYKLPVFATAGTADAGRWRDAPELRWMPLADGSTVSIGALGITPVAVPHDASEPVQFVFSDGAVRLALLTDIGHPDVAVVAALARLDALIIECNHDSAMLLGGPYPEALKRRISGDLGHLSNRQAAQLVQALDRSRLTQVVAAHLSRTNNRAELARAALADALGARADDIGVADQEQGIGWRRVG